MATFSHAFMAAAKCRCNDACEVGYGRVDGRRDHRIRSPLRRGCVWVGA